MPRSPVGGSAPPLRASRGELRRQSAHFAGQCTSVQARRGCAGRRGVRAVQIGGLPYIPVKQVGGIELRRVIVPFFEGRPPLVGWDSWDPPP